MNYEEVFNRFEDEYTDYLFANHRIGNGKMLVNLLEDADLFDIWIKEHHPEVEYD